MRFYQGISALSEFRQAKLLKRLREIDETINAVAAEFIHFVDTQVLSREEDSRLQQLLTYGYPFEQERRGDMFLITPRAGTISPWSSKATDIARNSGIKYLNRIERGTIYYVQSNRQINRESLAKLLHDRMTESVLSGIEEAEVLFTDTEPKPLITVNILSGGKAGLKKANKQLGLALTDDEIDYLYLAYIRLKRNPTDMELMMFAQINSEHCRHKIFNADWMIDGSWQPKSLFKMIRNTYETNNRNVLSAYSDNAAVISGGVGGRLFADPANGAYGYHQEPIHSVLKVETHNHPTAIAPCPGAATGVGGEIRDEGATGRGAKPKMGLAGYSVSNLYIPGAEQPWEKYYGKPARIASALDIMLAAPIGAATYANEFGRPNLAGYFRTYEQRDDTTLWGYHKPIMVAGGLGNIRAEHVMKQKLPSGAEIIVLGGPAMLIGLGGGAASSMQAGASSENLDFASVQRANAEMERRAQEVIDHCWALGRDNPVISIHDVGAGGLSNALPELVHDSKLGAEFELRDIPSAESGLSPLEIWCNEAQERYVLGISKEDHGLFAAICERERCPFAVVGVTTKSKQLVVKDRLSGDNPIDLPMTTLFGNPPKMTRQIQQNSVKMSSPLMLDKLRIDQAVKRVLNLPAVGSKKFLITIGDRSVGGLVVRDQMIGPWQVPVSDVAVTASAFDTDSGEAMAMGERAPLAVIDAPASARMAIGEAITNLLAADIDDLSDIKLSANWMAAAGYQNEDEKLFKTVRAIGEEFCPELGLTIPVGKDSLSMRTVWLETTEKSVTSPLSLVISAFSPAINTLKTLTPQLDVNAETSLILIDLGQGKNRLGGSALAQVYNQTGEETPDVNPALLRNFFAAIKSFRRADKILAYHDRSDGGLLAALCEMAFASRCGLDINLSQLPGSVIESLFSEELGAVIQIKQSDEISVLQTLGQAVGNFAYVIGRPTKKQIVTIKHGQDKIYEKSRAELEMLWSETSYRIQRLRDNPECADQEFMSLKKSNDPGLSANTNPKIFSKSYKVKPKVAIFREQGVNGQIEMAAAFDQAGFTSVDVHLNDIVAGRVALNDFSGLIACGGFSYGDVLGAGEGWAKTILFNKELCDKFSKFFNRADTFTLGVCNGCQMLSALKSLIPGAELWPKFLKNKSEQFEARLVMTKINDSPSIFFKGLAGACLPIPVAHGEGQAIFENTNGHLKALAANLVAMQYVDNNLEITEQYPSNPNGSLKGITALTTPDGRATIMMPHPERAFMSRQLSWHPRVWGEDSPWLQLFRNAREWLDK